MAKKKSKKSKPRRRRMSGPGGVDFKSPLGVMVGGVAGTYLVNGPLKTSSVVAPAMAIGGVIGAKFVKNPIGKAIMWGVAAAGAISLAQNAGVISGVRRMGSRVILNGPGSLSSIAGQRRGRVIGMNQAQANAVAARRNPGRGRVIAGGPLSAIAGVPTGWDDGDI